MLWTVAFETYLLTIALLDSVNISKLQIDWFKGKVKVANQLILSVNGPGLVEMRYFRLQKRTMDMSLLIYQCLQTDAKIVKTVDKLDVNCARENIFGGLSRNVWKEEWRTNAILAKAIQEEFILIFTYFLSVVDFMFFSSKLNHVILIWGSCLSHCPYLKKSVFNDDSNWCWEIDIPRQLHEPSRKKLVSKYLLTYLVSEN